MPPLAREAALVEDGAVRTEERVDLRAPARQRTADVERLTARRHVGVVACRRHGGGRQGVNGMRHARRREQQSDGGDRRLGPDLARQFT